jgi:hypothetical protein
MTSANHETYADWDAAYVLGSLSPAERREFEEHLRECVTCTANVSAIAGMPGLLGRLPDAQGLALVETSTAADEVPPDLLPRLELAARRERRRRRVTTWGIATAAAAAGVIGALALPPLLDGPPPTTVSAELSPVIDIPLTASIELTSADGGTQIEMWCDYPPGDPADAGTERSYDLYVVDAAGDGERVSTWTSRPGSSVQLTSGVETEADDIESVQIRSTDNGKVLLATTLD